MLVRMILHDVGGVLSALGWNGKLMEDRFGADDELVTFARDAIDELQSLCNDMREVTKNESHGLTVTLTRSDLREWFGAVAARAKVAIEKAGMQLEVDYQLTDTAVMTDTRLIERVLRNLYCNAIQAGTPGTIIVLRAKMQADGSLGFLVEDDGPGVPTDDHTARIARFLRSAFALKADGGVFSRSTLNASVHRRRFAPAVWVSR